MTKQEKLVSLLQPSNYKSKIKLFCAEIKTEKIVPQIFAQIDRKDYICRIKVIEQL